jgi:hypothetical protein
MLWWAASVTLEAACALHSAQPAPPVDAYASAASELATGAALNEKINQASVAVPFGTLDAWLPCGRGTGGSRVSALGQREHASLFGLMVGRIACLDARHRNRMLWPPKEGPKQ